MQTEPIHGDGGMYDTEDIYMLEKTNSSEGCCVSSRFLLWFQEHRASKFI